MSAPGRHVLAGGGGLDPDSPIGAWAGLGDEVVVVPLAAAFARPEALAERVQGWAAATGRRVTTVATVTRADASAPDVVAEVAGARCVLVLDGAAPHLVSGLKRTPLLEALESVAGGGGTVVWSGAAAAAACDPMVDDRGGAVTVGLGVVTGVVAVPAWEGWTGEARRRLRRLVPPTSLLLGLPTGSAVVPGEDGAWRRLGPGVEAEVDGRPVDLEPFA